MSDKPITPDIVRRVDALKQSLYRGDPRDIGADSKPSRRCEDCRFFKWHERGYCIHPNYVSVASPDIAIVSWSSVIRESGAVNACGPEGRLFEAKK